MKKLWCWIVGHRWRYSSTEPFFGDLVLKRERCGRCGDGRETVRLGKAMSAGGDLNQEKR